MRGLNSCAIDRDIYVSRGYQCTCELWVRSSTLLLLQDTPKNTSGEVKDGKVYLTCCVGGLLVLEIDRSYTILKYYGLALV